MDLHNSSPRKFLSCHHGWMCVRGLLGPQCIRFRYSIRRNDALTFTIAFSLAIAKSYAIPLRANNPSNNHFAYSHTSLLIISRERLPDSRNNCCCSDHCSCAHMEAKKTLNRLGFCELTSDFHLLKESLSPNTC